MTDNRLRCVLLYRLSAEEPTTTTILAKYGATNEALYGGRDNSYTEEVGATIRNDPPSALLESGTLGGFRVVQSELCQVVYGADGDGVCTSTQVAEIV